MIPKKATHKSAKSTTASGKTVKGFTDEERIAMKERVQELKTAARSGPRTDKADGESAVLAKIAEMPEPDRALGERLHCIITEAAPVLAPKTWYGMPAYARDGKAVVFFQAASKFKVRYAEVGFNEPAQLDDGDMWPTAYAVVAMNDAVAKKLTSLVTKAAG